MVSYPIQTFLDAFAKVAANSAHLKGTFVKALKDAAKNIKAVTEKLRTRPDVEGRRLQESNRGIKAEVGELRA